MDSYVFQAFEDFFGKITGWTDFYVLDIYYRRLWSFMKIHIFEDIINKNRISIENYSINLILHKELHFIYFIYFFFLHILFIIYIFYFIILYIYFRRIRSLCIVQGVQNETVRDSYDI